MSEISLIFVLPLKTNKTLNDMAKVQNKSEKLTPFGGFFFDYGLVYGLWAQFIGYGVSPDLQSGVKKCPNLFRLCGFAIRSKGVCIFFFYTPELFMVIG